MREKIAALEAQFEDATAKKAALAAQVADCQVKLQRADKLIGGLGGERSRWAATVQQLGADLHNIVGDVLMVAGASAPACSSIACSLMPCCQRSNAIHTVHGNAAACACCTPCKGSIAYSGAFVPSYRAALLSEWAAKLVDVGLPHSPNPSLIKTLADPVQVRVLQERV